MVEVLDQRKAGAEPFRKLLNGIALKLKPGALGGSMWRVLRKQGMATDLYLGNDILEIALNVISLGEEVQYRAVDPDIDGWSRVSQRLGNVLANPFNGFGLIA